MEPRPRPAPRSLAALALILILATGLRAYRLGTPSLWYDEVVSMRLARSDGPADLVRLLDRIDATRAPLHPLALQGWLRAIGPSDLAGRAFSALCGVATVASIFSIGRSLDGDRTGLRAAGLAAISPLLVQYSQEVRMYAWLVLVTCLTWQALLALRDSASRHGMAALAIGQAALIYSHPLGLLMVGAQGLAFLADRRSFRIGFGRWLSIQAAVALAAAPWVGRYFDHEPESVSGRLPIRFLLGLPIGFTGGNSLTLLACVAIVGLGTFAARPGGGRASGSKLLWIWFAVPPVLLYAYSYAAHPIFGPARYTLFVGPAYLILLARGLVRLPDWVQGAFAIVILGLAGSMLSDQVYAPGLKADWRGAVAVLRDRDARTVVVLSADPALNVEVETARYYLGPGIRVVPPSSVPEDGRAFVIAVGLRGGRPVIPLPDDLADRSRQTWARDLPGLRLVGLEARDPTTR